MLISRYMRSPGNYGAEADARYAAGLFANPGALLPAINYEADARMNISNATSASAV